MALVTTSLYRHTQTTASDLWTITHKLGHGKATIPAVDVLVDNNGSTVKIMPENINFIDIDTLSIEFTSPRTGTAIIVV